MAEKENDKSVTRSISRATQILRCLSNNMNTVSEIAGHSNVSLSTVHRLLNTLKELGWVKQDPVTHHYYLGPLVNEIASNSLASYQMLIVYSQNQMVKLSEFTGETINLSILLKLHYVLLHHIPSNHDLRATEGSRGYGLPTTGASGKVLISQLDDEVIRQSLQSVNAQAELNSPVLDEKLFMSQINAIRQTGYGISYGELVHGITCISAPVKNYICPVALSIIGPDSRMTPRLNAYLEKLIAAGNAISDRLIDK